MKELVLPPGSSTGLRVARVLALVIIGIFLLAWLIGALLWWRGMFNDLDTILSAAFFDSWESSDIRAAAVGLSASPIVFPILWFVLETVLLFGFGTMSLVLYLRKPDWFGTYLAVVFMIVATSITGPVITRIDAMIPGFHAVYQVVLEEGSVFGLVTLLFLFPDGRFVPRWMKWVVPIAFAVYITVATVQLLVGAENRADTAILEIAPMLLMVGAGLASQLYRFAYKSGPMERKQTKYVLLSFMAFIAVVIASVLLFPNAITQAAPPTPLDLVGFLVQLYAASAAILGVIAAITLGVLWYRLWEIDVLIRRTTSYAIVTGLLVLVYFGSVVFLQRFFTAVTGQTSTIAIVLSTLLIAALFLPLRQRVQNAIDRRFFRSKYDAQQTLEAFAATVRDETDLDALTAELVRVIEETMQPEHVSVWLAPDVVQRAATGYEAAEEKLS